MERNSMQMTWVLAGLLAGMMVIAGATKLATPHPRLLEDPRMEWAGDFTAGQVKVIATAELLGAVGLVVPWLLDVAPVLTPIAALCLAAILVGAAVVHSRREEWTALAMPTALAALAVVVAVLRFGQLS